MFAEMVGNHVVSEETVEKDPAAVTAGSALSSKQLLLVDQQEKNLTGACPALLSQPQPICCYPVDIINGDIKPFDR